MNRVAFHFPSIVSFFSGVIISLILSHPKSPTKKKIPAKSAKSVHFLPNLKVHRHTHYYHFHHWMYFGIILISSLMFRRTFKGKRVIEAFFSGVILQGLSYSDRFRIKYLIPVV